VNPERSPLHASLDPASNEALVEKYGAVSYAAQSNVLSHPDQLATIAALHGLSPPAVETCRVLELGCSDGANLLPMAAELPDAEFVGCDLSPQAIAAARAMVAETGLGNVTLIEGDLRELSDGLGPFDFVIAHGVYSWVPPAVRDGLLELTARCLAPNGLVFVTYNVYPGCHVRQAAWEVLHYHIRHLSTARARLDAARTLASALSQAGRLQMDNDVLLRREFARIAQQPDSALYHDDLAVPNDPVYFHQFAEHARSHGLAFVSEGKLFNSSVLGFGAQMQSIFAERSRLEREQYIDFASMRRFRQSVLCRIELEAALEWTPARTEAMHAAASLSLRQTAAQGKALLNPTRPPIDGAEKATLEAVLRRLVEIAPRALPVAELEAQFRSMRRPPGPVARSIGALLADAAIADEVLLHVRPPRAKETPSPRPLASPVARLQARRGTAVTNLEHVTIQLPDAPPRALLALLDGERDAAALDVAVGAALEVDEPAARRRRIDQYVRQFARLGLLIA